MAHPLIERATTLASKLLDLRMAFAGAAFMGTLVFAVNVSHGVGPALVAAAKQASYTFFFAGMVMRLAERLASTLDPRALAVTVATVVPSILAVSLTFGVHSLRGTPDPIASTLPTLFLGPPSFFVWAWRTSAQPPDPESAAQNQPSKGAARPSRSNVAGPNGSNR